jgi:pyrroline-5-carboxylate reductase
MKTIGIIGFGNMGAALAAGLIKSDAGFKVITSEKKEDRVSEAKKQKVDIRENDALVRESDIVILAVKPQELETLFGEIGSLTKNKRIISIAAGKKISFFSGKLGTDRVARFMPNLAASEHQALVGISFADGADNEFKKDCAEIASAIGVPMELPESLMPAVTGLSGSGIAFVFSFAHAMALGGVSAGIPYPKALDIAIQTIAGAVAVLEKSKENPIELLSKVISPAGTTIRGIAALEKDGFTHSVIDAVESASVRAKELEG